MWTYEPHRHALLELWSSGRLQKRKRNAGAWEELERLRWARRTSRRDELELLPGHREDLERLLDHSWRDWRAVADELRRTGIPLDGQGIHRLKSLERRRLLSSELPKRLNQRTAAAILAPHSKASLPAEHVDSLRDIDLYQDGILRLRPSCGLTLRRGLIEVDAGQLADLLGEVVLSERALREGTRLAGVKPAALLLVENVGAYLDLTPPEGWLVALVPGWDTGLARILLAQLADIPAVLFGDLDPNGVLIAQHLKTHRPDLIWAVPDFWEEVVDSHGHRKPWPPELRLDDAPLLVRTLAARGLWLEQEAIVLDPRLRPWLERAVQPFPSTSPPGSAGR